MTQDCKIISDRAAEYLEAQFYNFLVEAECLVDPRFPGVDLKQAQKNAADKSKRNKEHFFL
jgi:hypothetical protein